MLLYIFISVYIIVNALTFVLGSDRSRGFFIPAIWCIVFFAPFALRDWSYASRASREFTEYGAYILLGIFILSATYFIFRELYDRIYSSILLRNYSAKDIVNAHNMNID